MIDQLNVNHRVGRIDVRIRNSNPIDIQLLEKIRSNCHNLYFICIGDYYDQVKNDMHNVLKSIAQ